jgi:hypothetical protein
MITQAKKTFDKIDSAESVSLNPQPVPEKISKKVSVTPSDNDLRFRLFRERNSALKSGFNYYEKSKELPEGIETGQTFSIQEETPNQQINIASNITTDYFEELRVKFQDLISNPQVVAEIIDFLDKSNPDYIRELANNWTKYSSQIINLPRPINVERIKDFLTAKLDEELNKQGKLNKQADTSVLPSDRNLLYDAIFGNSKSGTQFDTPEVIRALFRGYFNKKTLGDAKNFVKYEMTDNEIIDVDEIASEFKELYRGFTPSKYKDFSDFAVNKINTTYKNIKHAISLLNQEIYNEFLSKGIIKSKKFLDFYPKSEIDFNFNKVLTVIESHIILYTNIINEYQNQYNDFMILFETIDQLKLRKLLKTMNDKQISSYLKSLDDYLLDLPTFDINLLNLLTKNNYDMKTIENKINLAKTIINRHIMTSGIKPTVRSSSPSPASSTPSASAISSSSSLVPVGTTSKETISMFENLIDDYGESINRISKEISTIDYTKAEKNKIKNLLKSQSVDLSNLLNFPDIPSNYVRRANIILAQIQNLIDKLDGRKTNIIPETVKSPPMTIPKAFVEEKTTKPKKNKSPLSVKDTEEPTNTIENPKLKRNKTDEIKKRYNEIYNIYNDYMRNFSSEDTLELLDITNKFSSYVEELESFLKDTDDVILTQSINILINDLGGEIDSLTEQIKDNEGIDDEKGNEFDEIRNQLSTYKDFFKKKILRFGHSNFTKVYPKGLKIDGKRTFNPINVTELNEKVLKDLDLVDLIKIINDIRDISPSKIGIAPNSKSELFAQSKHEPLGKGKFTVDEIIVKIDGLVNGKREDIKTVYGLGLGKNKKQNPNHHIINNKYYVDKSLLDNGLYELRYLKNKHLKNKPITMTNKQLSDMVKKIIYSKEYTNNDIETLPKEQQYIVYKIMKDMDLDIPSNANFNNEFNMLLGQIQNGNTNEVIKQKFKRALSMAYDFGKITRHQMEKIKMDLNI